MKVLLNIWFWGLTEIRHGFAQKGGMTAYLFILCFESLLRVCQSTDVRMVINYLRCKLIININITTKSTIRPAFSQTYCIFVIDCCQWNTSLGFYFWKTKNESLKVCSYLLILCYTINLVLSISAKVLSFFNWALLRMIRKFIKEHLCQEGFWLFLALCL